jgi:hypothetical protein
MFQVVYSYEHAMTMYRRKKWKPFKGNVNGDGRKGKSKTFVSAQRKKKTICSR